MPPKGSKIGPPPVPAANPDHPAAQQQQEHLEGISEFELPKTTLMKLAKGSVRLVPASCSIWLRADTWRREDPAGDNHGAVTLVHIVHQLPQCVSSCHQQRVADVQLLRMCLQLQATVDCTDEADLAAHMTRRWPGLANR